jgi:hypothetical protein
MSLFIGLMSGMRTPLVQESDLVAMAHDPAIQRELAQINAEFAATEADGLDQAP